jgi:hypothetical protein
MSDGAERETYVGLLVTPAVGPWAVTLAGKVGRVTGQQRWASGGPMLMVEFDPDDADDPWLCNPEHVRVVG